MDVLQFGLYNLGVLSNLAWTLVERDFLLCGPDRQTERCEHEFQALQPLSLLSLAAAMADSLNKSGSHHSPGLLLLFSSCAGCYSRDWLTCNNSRPPPPPPPRMHLGGCYYYPGTIPLEAYGARATAATRGMLCAHNPSNNYYLSHIQEGNVT